jgi:hypothetical protein
MRKDAKIRMYLTASTESSDSVYFTRSLKTDPNIR